MIIFFIISAVILGIFVKRMSLFPIKERAPKLTLVQGIMFFMIVFIPYVSDFWVDSWSNIKSSEEIPWSRKILKSLYLSVRLFCYFIFGVRTIIIYSNWKLGEYKDVKYGKRKAKKLSRLEKFLQKAFRTEEKGLLVRF